MYHYASIDKFLTHVAEDISQTIADFYLLEAIKNTGHDIANVRQYITNNLTKLALDFKQKLLAEVGTAIWVEFVVINYALHFTRNALVNSRDVSNSFFEEIQDFYDILGSPREHDHAHNSIREWAKQEMDMPQAPEELEAYMPVMEDQFSYLGGIGKTWIGIIKAWQGLYNSTELNNVIIALDHLIEIQHVTGNILERTSLEIDDEILGIKANQTSLWELYDLASPGIKKVTAPIIKQIEGTGYDMYLEQPKKMYPIKPKNVADRYPEEEENLKYDL
jgi:hypothetical protein